MTTSCRSANRFVSGGLAAPGQAAGLVHGASLRRQAVRVGLGRGMARTAHLSRLRNRPVRGNGMDDLRQGDARVQFAGLLGGLCPATDATFLAAESPGHGRRAARSGDEYGRQFRYEHQLAELRWRDDAELPDADARADCAELRVGRNGNGRIGGFDSRIRPPLGTDHWQLLVRPDPKRALHPSSAVGRRGFGARVARSGADVAAVSDRDVDSADDGCRWKGRYGTAYCRWSGRVSGDYQATGHQRRRLLQRQLRTPLREPDAFERISSRCWPFC